MRVTANSLVRVSVGVLVVAAIAVVPGLGAAKPAQASPSPSSLTVGVDGAAASSVGFSGGPITGSADESGEESPVACADPACESISITVAAPSGFPQNEIGVSATVAYTPSSGPPTGTSGLDVYLENASGTIVSSSVGATSPAYVAGGGANAGDVWTLEITGEQTTTAVTYTGTVSADVPATTSPAAPSGTFIDTVLPPAPASGLTGTNEDAEPGIGVDGSGTFWVASDIEPYAASDQRALEALSGTDVWKSTDDGKTWQFVASPFNDTDPGKPNLGGEDTDIAVAPVKNSNGFYNVYVASLWVGSTNVAVSEDGGNTWNVTQINGVPVQDRPWLAADGACIFYLSYHAIAPYDTVVDKYDACNAQDQAVGSAVDPTETTLFAANILPTASNRFGKQAVDTSPLSPYQHRIYVPMEGCTLPTIGAFPEEGVNCQGDPEVYVGYADPPSGAGSLSFTDVAVAPVDTGKLFIWPDTIAVDSAGNVYLAWFDDQHAYIAVSRDGGAHWGSPIQVNTAPALSAVYPTVAASGPGHVEVAFYGSTRAGDADDGSIMQPPNTGDASQWQLFWADSTDYGQHWRQSTVTPTIHTGVLCYNGSGCGEYAGDRNLLDDFGLAISPTTGTAVMAFSNDQPNGTNGQTHTDVATEAAPPASSTPEFGYPAGVMTLVMLLAGGAAVLARRRRARQVLPD